MWIEVEEREYYDASDDSDRSRTLIRCKVTTVDD